MMCFNRAAYQQLLIYHSGISHSHLTQSDRILPQRAQRTQRFARKSTPRSRRSLRWNRFLR